MNQNIWLKFTAELAETPEEPTEDLVKSVIRTCLLNGFETWPLCVKDQICLQVFDYACLRRFLGHRRRILSHAKFSIIAFTSAPSLQCSCNPGSDDSDMLLAVLPTESSVT